jgi:hypothetical protein
MIKKKKISKKRKSIAKHSNVKMVGKALSTHYIEVIV